MDMDRANLTSFNSHQSSAGARYSRRERRKPEVFNPTKEELKSPHPDLKVKFKVTKHKGLKTTPGAKQFKAESSWQAAHFARKVVKELGLSPKYQYSILIFDSDKGWVKLSSLSQLSPSCQLRVYRIKQRQPEPKPEPTPVQPRAPAVQPASNYMQLQSFMAAYTYMQYQQMMLAYQQYGYPYAYYHQ
jgi:hypothetical protein